MTATLKETDYFTEVLAHLVSTTQNAHEQLVEGVVRLNGHNLDPQAHGLDNPESPMRKAVAEIAQNALDAGSLDDRISKLLDKSVKDALDETMPGAIGEKLPALVESEFNKADSTVRQILANQVETIIDDKIESGQISGGGSGSKPSTKPDAPDNPEPDMPDVPENPDEPQPAAVAKPEILSPAHGSTGLGIPFTVTISEFAVTNEGTDTAKAVQLQVAKDSKFDNIVFDTGEIAPTRQIQVNSGISFNEVAYLRARYIGNSLGEGPWSTFVGVTTREVLIESDDFWNVMPDPTGACTITDWGAEPELNLSLNGGPMYAAPSIDGAEIWRAGGNVFIRLAQDSGMAINPAVKYECFVTGDETLREVQADANGFAQFSFVANSKLTEPALQLVAAVAIDADGNRSAIAKREFKIVPKSHQLCAGSLEEGTDFPAPAIECKSFWKRESRVTMTVAPTSDAIPARYEAFAEGFDNIVSVNADAEGKATIGITLPSSVQGETKILVRVVPVAASGRHGKAANKVLNIVTNDITLTPVFITPLENEPINTGNVVFQLQPFETLCGDVAEQQDAARYRILDENGVAVFDSGILTQAANRDRYAAYAPDMPNDPGLVYILQARVRGASLGWSEWASRKVCISQVGSPSIVSPANGASFIWGGGIPCESSEFTLPAGGFDEHTASDWKLCYDNLGLDVICEELDSPDLINHTIVPDDVRDGANCFIFCRHKAQTAGISAWSVPGMVKTSSGGVNKAVISSPTPDATISVNDAGVTLSAAAFGTDGLNDAHIASDWKICADINGASILVQALDSPDLLAHTFSVGECASLANGSTYYLFTRQKGGRLGWGPWSDPVAFTAKKAGVRAAQITAPAANALIVFNDTGITLSTAAFSVDGASDSHVATDWKITTDSAGNTPVLQSNESADKLSHAFTAAQCAALADGATLYAFARHKGSRFGYGPWSAGVVIKMKKGVVNTPAILTPEQNAGILVMDNSLSVTASAFGVNAGTDSHSKTDWKLTSDAAGNNVILQDLNSTDLTAHTFKNLTIGVNLTNVWLWTRQHGLKFGASAWSAGRPISIRNAMTTSGGRKYYRHPSNKGGVVVANILGQTTHLFVADASYRTKAVWDNQNTDITKLTNYTDIPTTRFNGSSVDITTADAKTVTDDQLNARYGNRGKHDDASAKANTDILAARSGCAAARHCRSVEVDGRGCDLGNIQQMALVYCESETFDAYDPTVAAYPANKLSGWNIAGATIAWSSTERSNDSVWGVISNGRCDGIGGKDYPVAVVPVQELEI